MGEQIERALRRVLCRGIAAEAKDSALHGAEVVNIYKAVDGSERPDHIELNLASGSRIEFRIRAWRVDQGEDEDAEGAADPRDLTAPLFPAPEGTATVPGRKSRRRTKATTTVPPSDDPAEGLGDDEPDGDAS